MHLKATIGLLVCIGLSAMAGCGGGSDSGSIVGTWTLRSITNWDTGVVQVPPDINGTMVFNEDGTFAATGTLNTGDSGSGTWFTEGNVLVRTVASGSYEDTFTVDGHSLDISFVVSGVPVVSYQFTR